MVLLAPLRCLPPLGDLVTVSSLGRASVGRTIVTYDLYSRIIEVPNTKIETSRRLPRTQSHHQSKTRCSSAHCSKIRCGHCVLLRQGNGQHHTLRQREGKAHSVLGFGSRIIHNKLMSHILPCIFVVKSTMKGYGWPHSEQCIADNHSTAPVLENPRTTEGGSSTIVARATHALTPNNGEGKKPHLPRSSPAQEFDHRQMTTM